MITPQQTTGINPVACSLSPWDVTPNAAPRCKEIP